MGLDMYLSAKRHISGYGFKGPEAAAQYRDVLDRVGLAAFADESTPSADVSVCVGYWRKANAIHGWFVENVQRGVDECQESYVPREMLATLRQACVDALAGKHEKSLPTRGGFFFGSTEYDEGYKQDLEDTIKIIDRLEKLPDDCSLYYQSSW